MIMSKDLLKLFILFFHVWGLLFCQEKLKEKISNYIKDIEKVREERFFKFPGLKPIKRRELARLANNIVKNDYYLTNIIPFYKKLGFIKDNVTLKKIKYLFKKMFLEQISAFYSMTDGNVYFYTHNIVKPLQNFRFGENIGLTPLQSVFVHELVHALDYQNFERKLREDREYFDRETGKLIIEGSAMFTLFLYAAYKKNKDSVQFLEENLHYLPIHYSNTGYKWFDRLPSIVKYDITLPYSLGARIFYRMFKSERLKIFRKIFYGEFKCISELLAYVNQSYNKCYPLKLKELLYRSGIKKIKQIDKLSLLNVLAMILSIYENDAKPELILKLMEHFNYISGFEIDKDSVLLVMKLKNRKVARQVFDKFSGKYACLQERKFSMCSSLSKTIPNKHIIDVKNYYGFNHKLLLSNKYVILFVYNNNMSKKTKILWKKILNSLK